MNFRVKTFWIRIGICVWWIVENHLGKYSRCVGGCMLGHFIIVRFHVPSWCNVMRGTWSLTTIQCYKSKQDGAASESSSSRGRIVRKFSCQEIRHWSLDFGHWILELRHWTLELVHWTLKCCNSVVMFWKYCDRDVMWFDSIVFDSIDQFGLVFPSSFWPLEAEIVPVHLVTMGPVCLIKLTRKSWS